MKIRKKEFIPYGIAIVMLLIATFYDYQITDALYNPTSIIGIFFARIALLPVQSMVLITIALLYKKRHNILLIGMGAIVSFYIVHDALQAWMNTRSKTMFVIMVLLSLLYEIIIFYIISRCSKQWAARYLSFFIFFSVVLLSAIVITSILKTYWGRIRYRDLANASEFCVWYKPCGLSGNYSFPSGHMTAFTAILCFLQLKHHRYQKVAVSRYLIVTCLIVLMAISRMIMGAHFLSDTAMGFMITYSTYLIYRHIFIKGGYL